MEKENIESVVIPEYTVEDIRAMNIHQRMWCVTNEIEYVVKKLKVPTSKDKSYKAVSEGDILKAVKPLEFKYRIYSYPVERTVPETKILTTVDTYGDNKKEKNQLFMRIKTKYRFCNIDMPKDYVDVDSYGDGVDTQDKAPGKAMTYSDKYALMKGYKIETGDDPDKDASGELIRVTDTKVEETVTPEVMVSLNDAKILETVLSKEEIEMTLEYYKIKNLNQLTAKQASALMKRKASQ